MKPSLVELAPVGPEATLLIPLAWHRPRRHLEQLGHRRTVALALFAIVTAANALGLVSLIGSLTTGQELELCPLDYAGLLAP